MPEDHGVQDGLEVPDGVLRHPGAPRPLQARHAHDRGGEGHARLRDVVPLRVVFLGRFKRVVFMLIRLSNIQGVQHPFYDSIEFQTPLGDNE